MIIDWRKVLVINEQKIIKAAKDSGISDEVVCVLFDLDIARAGKELHGALHLIAESELKGAVPINDPEKKRTLVCLPVSKDVLFKTLESAGDISVLKEKILFRGTVVMWAICMEGEDRQIFDLHAVTPDRN